jgi:hypothetical protein
MEEPQERVHLLCLNPHCLQDHQRCLTTRSLPSHPSECSPFYYPAQEVLDRPWR